MRKLMLLILLIPALTLWGCSSDGDGDGGDVTQVTPEDEAAAEQAATDSMEELMDGMEGVVGEEYDIGDLEALQEMELTEYEEGFNDALALDPECSSAHFGLAVIKMLQMNEANGLDDLMDLVGENGLVLPTGLVLRGHSTLDLLAGGLMGRSFTIMHRAPLALVPQEISLAAPTADKDGEALIRELQTHIHDVLIPTATAIVNHLSHASNNENFHFVIPNDDGTEAEFDLGDVYVLEAIARALRAGLYIATAYDVELAPTGDYTWLTEPFVDTEFTSYELTDEGMHQHLKLIDDEEVTLRRQYQLQEHIESLLSPGSHFLTLWTDPWSGENAMSAAHGDMQTLLTRLELAYAFIQAEDDPQENDVITQMMLTELDAAILEMGADIPEYLGTWEALPDIINWVESLISGPYTFEIPQEDEEVLELTVNISALFTDPVEDWKTKLPYMTWLDFEDFAAHDETHTDGPYLHDPTQPYPAIIGGEEMVFENISSYSKEFIYWVSEAPFLFLDGPGGEPLGEGELFPYFPDYTFGGLFPDMTRDNFLLLLN